MQSPIQRLYKTKFVLLSVIATVAGYVLMLVGHWVSGQPGLSFWKDVDPFDIGVALMTSGLVAVAFQFIGNADATAENKRQLREAIRDEAPAIRDSVVDAWAFTPEKMLDVTAPEVLDRVIENSLTKQLGDERFATAIYQDLKAHALRSDERWHDLRISATLSPWRSDSRAKGAPMFEVSFRYDYYVTDPQRVMRFASVSDLDEYRELHADPQMAEVWYFEPKLGLDGASPDAFKLEEVTVGGKRQTVRRTTKAGSQLFTVYLGSDARMEHGATAVSFTYRALVQQHGHLLRIDLTKPTEGLSISFAYGGTGIRYVNVTDYIGTAKQPTISRRPAKNPNPVISLTSNDWVMPHAGVAFVWVLESEMPQ